MKIVMTRMAGCSPWHLGLSLKDCWAEPYLSSSSLFSLHVWADHMLQDQLGLARAGLGWGCGGGCGVCVWVWWGVWSVCVEQTSLRPETKSV